VLCFISKHTVLICTLEVIPAERGWLFSPFNVLACPLFRERLKLWQF